jgi:hypothetical protein
VRRSDSRDCRVQCMNGMAHLVRRYRYSVVIMSIVYERNQWEPGQIYYFRTRSGKTPICQVALAVITGRCFSTEAPSTVALIAIELSTRRRHTSCSSWVRARRISAEMLRCGAWLGCRGQWAKRDQPLVTSQGGAQAEGRARQTNAALKRQQVVAQSRWGLTTFIKVCNPERTRHHGQWDA